MKTNIEIIILLYYYKQECTKCFQRWLVWNKMMRRDNGSKDKHEYKCIAFDDKQKQSETLKYIFICLKQLTFKTVRKYF
jgi:hypothetical protein